MADLNEEIWLPELLENFIPDDSFLKEAKDMSAFVEYDKINIAEAGAFPDVLVNNNTYPIPTTQRTDKHISIELGDISTTSTLLRRVDQIELKYDKMASIISGHKEAMRQKALQLAAFEYAPSQNGKYTPVISASGPDEGNGVKKLTFEDLLELDTAFDNAEIPQDGRILLLSATHKKHLRQEDITAYKDIFERKLFGAFKVYSLADDRMPRYNKTSGAKLPSESNASTKTISSIAFHKNEVMRAMGSAEMFAKRKDPDNQGDTINFLVRFKAVPIRNKGIGAVYSGAV